MKCKFCFAELEEDVAVCPACGKDLTEIEETPVEETVEETPAEETPEEETEEEFEEESFAKKKKKFPKALAVVLAAVGGLALAAALTIAVLYGMGIKLSSVGAFFGFTEADIDYKSNYTVSDKKVAQKADEIVARVGDQTLTNGQLEVYYWMTARDFVSNYYYYLQSLGLDTAKPLNEQIYDEETGLTWQQFFLGNAIETWRRYAIFVQMAEDADFTLSQEWQDYLNSYNEEMNAAAVESGYADAEEFIDKLVSKGSSVATYYDYFCTESKALAYVDTIAVDLAPTLDELEAYYTANEETMTSGGYGKDAGKYYDVRHIFITVEGEMTDGAYTDAQWEACRAKAQKLLDDFLANDPTEAKFAELAKEHSEDPGSADNGGLYSGLTKDYGFIQEFEDWYMDESRKPGDTGIVKNTGSSEVGYHIMYFSDSVEIWKDQAETQVLAEKMAKVLKDSEAQYPADVNYKKIVLGNADITVSLS